MKDSEDFDDECFFDRPDFGVDLIGGGGLRFDWVRR